MASAASPSATSRRPQGQNGLAYVALGSNLGDPATQLRAALSRLAELHPVVARSSLYATLPVGGPAGQAEYLNAVVALDVHGTDPHQLLLRLLSIERDLGRVRSERWGPRLIDLDLLAVGDAVVDTATHPADAPSAATVVALSLPHPRLAERGFVLVPLCEIASRRNEMVQPWVHPLTGLTACAMLERLAAEAGAQQPARDLGVRRTDLRW